MRLMYRLAVAALATGFPAVTVAVHAAPAAGSVPDFSGMTKGWLAMGTDFKGVPGGPQPVGDDPAHPHVGNGQGKQSTFRFANIDNPNLTDFAKAGLKRT